jgi:4-hydroxy-3-polyprenylbenzoate decarboxylase
MVNHSTARALDLFDIESSAVKRWAGLKDALQIEPAQSDDSVP